MTTETKDNQSITPQQTAYVFLRITMGINFLGHGLVRMPKLEGFRNWMVGAFQETILPSWSVAAWSSVLPFLELGIGICLILGVFTYRASMAGALTIMILILGACLIENWEWVSFQMIYALFFAILISQIEKNAFCIRR